VNTQNVLTIVLDMVNVTKVNVTVLQAGMEKIAIVNYVHQIVQEMEHAIMEYAYVIKDSQETAVPNMM
jgi:hypothetical protein